MKAYVVKRLLMMPVVLLMVATLIFFLTHAIPGSAIRILLGPHAGEAQIQQATEEFALDRPLLVQYGIYMKKLFQGDLGQSIVSRRPVIEDLMTYFPATIELSLAALILIIIVGVILGAVAAIHRSSLLDMFARGVAVGGVAMPQFWLGLMFILIFFYWSGFLPGGGRLDLTLTAPKTITGMYVLDSLLTGNWATLRNSLIHLFLPAVTLALTNMSTTTAMVRSSMLHTLSEDYITMAQAYGFSKTKVHYVYALKNSLISAVSVLGLTTGYLLGGTVLVETVFDWPGVGLFASQAILNVDYAPIIGVTMLISFVYVVMNLIADILYAVLDPRIRY
ncbi:MAG: ABC transporter permease [Deltaproteobacteria bacterium]|nr:ABC transporter permease [Deltaproteobacteria bacterium]